MTPGPDDDLPTSPGMPSDPGERYERGSRIATGGMGEVWRARDKVLGREVAVKILKSEYADDPTFRARFEAEARHAAGLHHPGIASVFDYGMLAEGNMPYLVMELVDGKPLSDLLAGGQPIDPEVARGLALQVAEALAVAHAAGVVHRDVKPANLLVTPDGRVKITDFGIALATNSVAFTQTGQIVGTPQYLSPEQARGNPATAASDVYALGVVLFECLAGRRPFIADTPIATALAQIQQDVPPLPDSVPTGLAAVVDRALAKDPSQRYADGAAIATALREAADGGLPTAAVPLPVGDATQVLPAAAAPVAAGAAFASVPRSEPIPVPVDEPDRDERRKRSPWPLVAAGLLALLLLAALLLARPWETDEAPTDDGTESSAPTDPQDETVSVRRADYIGEPVDEAVADLEDLGLETRTTTRENSGDQEAGTVADLNPTGSVKAGATITLDVWGEVPDEEPAEPAPTEDKQDDKPDKPDKPDKSDDQGTGNGQGSTEDPGGGTVPEQPVDPGAGVPSANPGRAQASAPVEPSQAGD